MMVMMMRWSESWMEIMSKVKWEEWGKWTRWKMMMMMRWRIMMRMKNWLWKYREEGTTWRDPKFNISCRIHLQIVLFLNLFFHNIPINCLSFPQSVSIWIIPSVVVQLPDQRLKRLAIHPVQRCISRHFAHDDHTLIIPCRVSI